MLLGCHFELKGLKKLSLNYITFNLQHLPAGMPFIDLKVYVVSQLWLTFTLLQTCAACAN